jgi:hypothetical protein
MTGIVSLAISTYIEIWNVVFNLHSHNCSLLTFHTTNLHIQRCKTILFHQFQRDICRNGSFKQHLTHFLNDTSHILTTPHTFFNDFSKPIELLMAIFTGLDIAHASILHICRLYIFHTLVYHLYQCIVLASVACLGIYTYPISILVSVPETFSCVS